MVTGSGEERWPETGCCAEKGRFFVALEHPQSNLSPQCNDARLALELRDVSLRALHLLAGLYILPFEGVYNICTYDIGTL